MDDEMEATHNDLVEFLGDLEMESRLQGNTCTTCFGYENSGKNEEGFSFSN